MLKIFFNRTSPLVRLLELIGVILSVWFLTKRLPTDGVVPLLFLFLFCSYLFVRICDGVNWYPREKNLPPDPKRFGIRVQFQKAIVPSAYILAITAAVALLEIPFLSTGVITFAVLLMLIVAPVNGILLYFHLRDKDPTPINYFSLNKYLGEDTAPPPNPSSVQTRSDRSLRLPGQAEPDPVNTRSL